MLAARLDLFSEAALSQSVFIRLRDWVFVEELLGGEIEVDVLASNARAVESVALGEVILPLGVGARRIDGWNGDASGFTSVGITHQGDDAIALGDVLLDLFDERAWSLLEIFLDFDFTADGAGDRWRARCCTL